MDKHLDILTKLYKQYLKRNNDNTLLPSSKIIKYMIKLYWMGISDFTVDKKMWNLILEYMKKVERMGNRDKYLNNFSERITHIWGKRELDIK